jgi:hypothetical protein
VSKTIGNVFVPDYTWDFLPVEDCALLDLAEAAGIDQPLPLCTRNMHTLRSRNRFIENAVESASAQSSHYGVTECAPNVDPYNQAADDAEGSQANQPYVRAGINDLGDGVRMIYANNGEKVTWSSAKLPDPDFVGFNDKIDERMARGFVASKSRFTRTVNSSWAGGRLEDQQDDPIIDQYRQKLKAAWQIVNGWFLEAIWLTGAAELPGYSAANAHLWNEYRAEFPGKVEINQADSANASEKNLMLRRSSPQREIEKTGGDGDKMLDEWGQWYVKTANTEKKYKIPEGALQILFGTKSVTTSAGEDVGAPAQSTEPTPGEREGERETAPAKTSKKKAPAP